MRTTFFILLITGFSFRSFADWQNIPFHGRYVNVNSSTGQYEFYQSDFTVSYSVHVSMDDLGGEDISIGNVLSVIELAEDRWNAINTSYANLAVATTYWNQSSIPEWDDTDNIIWQDENGVYFSSDWDADEDQAAAITVAYYVEPADGCDPLPDPSPGNPITYHVPHFYPILIGFDMAFSPACPFLVVTANDSDGDPWVSLEDVVVHELGHALGLRHNTATSNSIMRDILKYHKYNPYLQFDDSDAITRLYSGEDGPWDPKNNCGDFDISPIEELQISGTGCFKGCCQEKQAQFGLEDESKTALMVVWNEAYEEDNYQRLLSGFIDNYDILYNSIDERVRFDDLLNHGGIYAEPHVAPSLQLQSSFPSNYPSVDDEYEVYADFNTALRLATNQLMPTVNAAFCCPSETLSIGFNAAQIDILLYLIQEGKELPLSGDFLEEVELLESYIEQYGDQKTLRELIVDYSEYATP